MDNIIEIKEKIRDFLSENYSQAEIARKLGQDRKTINKELKGTFEKTSINKLVKMLNSVGYRLHVRIEKD